MKKKILSMFLALVMVLSVALPAQAAGTEVETTWEAADFTYGEISQEMYPATNMSDKTTYSGIGITGFSESGLEKFATNKNVVLPSEDTEGNKIVGVGTSAFDAKGLESVKLPEDAKDWVIANYAFRKNSLTSVDLSGVVYVGLYAFQTNKLTSVKFDENIWWIYTGAFAKNEISTLDFPAKTDKALNIDQQAFLGNKLTTVRIPSNTEKLNKYTFMQNTGVETVVSSNSNEKKGGVVYMYTNDLSTWNQPYITYVGSGSTVQRLIYEGPVTEAEGRVYDSGSNALAAVKAGTGVILDIRATEKTDNLYLADSLKQPVFGPSVTTLKDQLAFDFVAFANNNADLKGKDIYVLCNSGSKGAEAATRLLVSLGYKMEDIITIKNGAKDNDIIGAFEVRQTKTTGEARTVTGAQAVAAIENTKEVAIIDVRAKEKFAVGHLKNSVNLPLFTLHPESGSNVAITDYAGELATAFTNYVKDNADLAGKEIYIVCNAGALGAKNGAKLLYLAGYDLDKVYTITGGATDADVKSNLKFVTPEQALNVIEDKTNYQIIDVRAKEKYAEGHLKNSISLPLFTLNESGGNVAVQAPYEDDLSKAFVDYVNANKETLAAKTIYIVCNSGQSGVKNAFALMEKTGLLDKTFGISGGAKALDKKLNFVTAEHVLSVRDDVNTLVIDVRAKERYEAGHIENSVNLPLFTVNPETNGNVAVQPPYEDDLSKAFVNYVNTNKEILAGKNIFILCNSGQSGVKNAFALLDEAGLAAYGITGGATNESLQKIFVKDIIDVTAKQSYKKLVYTGKNRIPTITLTDETGYKLVKGTDYTTAVYNSKGNKVTTYKAVGKYTIKITFIGKYADNDPIKLTYSIVPKAVTNLKASLVPSNGYDDVKLTWTKSTGATGYYVYYKKSTTASYSTKYRKTVTGNNVTIKNLTDGAKYNFKVVPYYGSNKVTSTKSTVVNKTTLKKVTGVKVTRNGKKVKVSWKNINGETGYQISCSTKKTRTDKFVICSGSNLKNKTITLTKAGKRYYKVRAYKVENGKKVFGPWSAVVYK